MQTQDPEVYLMMQTQDPGFENWDHPGAHWDSEWEEHLDFTYPHSST